MDTQSVHITTSMGGEKKRMNAETDQDETPQMPPPFKATCVRCGSNDHQMCCSSCGGQDGTHYEGCESR